MNHMVRCLLISIAIAQYSPQAHAEPITIIDTLGVATPATRFDPGGGSGPAFGFVFSTRFLLFGPAFTLTRSTRLTEIGGFVEPCIQNFISVNCPDLSARVQIHPAVNGVPDASDILAAFDLSNDRDPELVSYESVTPNLLLAPGNYFALFTSPRPDLSGYVLGTALGPPVGENPFSYRSLSTLSAQLDATTGTSDIFVGDGAVRIIGVVVPEPSTLSLFAVALTAFAGLASVGPARVGYGLTSVAGKCFLRASQRSPD